MVNQSFIKYGPAKIPAVKIARNTKHTTIERVADFLEFHIKFSSKTSF
jgi:hypothetical protein